MRRNAFIFLAIAVVLTGVPDPFYAMMAKRGEERKMDFQEFSSREKDAGDFIITVDGDLQESHFTGKRYVHYETIVFTGATDATPEWRILYHTEGDITIRLGKESVTVGYRNMRTSLSPSWERTYSADELRQSVSGIEKSLASMLDEGKPEPLTLREYGLEPGKRYHARIKTESYYLPPGPEGEPKQKKNRVLVISDRPLAEGTELTPLYRGWSY